MLATILKDVQLGIRLLRKSPGFSLIAMASIAIGVGANAATFSLADTLVLRPLTIPRAADVVTVTSVVPTNGFLNPNASALSYPDFIDVRDQSRSFASLMAFRLVVAGLSDRRTGPAQRRFGLAVSANLFDGLGVPPALGRSFTADEDRAGGREAVVILDHDWWAQQFASNSAVIGQHLTIGGVDATVIGVMPAQFTGPDQFVHPAFYIPLALLPRLYSLSDDELVRRDVRNIVVKGRLKTGVSMAAARVDVAGVGANLARTYPDSNRNRELTVKTEFGARVDARPQLAVLAAMLITLAGAVLVVACANLAGLLSSRAPARAREIALRLAIGAGRARLMRQLIVESLLIAAGGALAGLIVGQGVIALFQRLELPTDVPLKLAFALDGRVLLVGIGVAALSAIASSLVPAWQSLRVDLVTTLKAHGGDTSGRVRAWGRQALVCTQIALSLLLLTVAVFLYRAYDLELGRGPGFRTDHLLILSFDPDLAGDDDAAARRFYDRLRERVRTMPGVRTVAFTTSVPMDAISIENTPIVPEGLQLPPGSESIRVRSARIDAGYFDTLGIRLLRGRTFTNTDDDSAPRVAVVNETFAARYWPGQDPLGKRFRIAGDASSWTEIVGLAANHKYRALSEGPTEFVYYSQRQTDVNDNSMLVQTEGDPAAMAGALRDAVRALDPNMPVVELRTMEAFYRSTAVTVGNLIVDVVGGMGSMGLTLSIIGLYGLVAYSVSRRTREIGIRMAIGAQPRSVLRMVMRQGLVLASAGTAIGLLASAAAGGLLRAVFPFPGVARVDLVTYAIVVPLLIATTLLAAYFPARRASRIDPLRTLRAE